MTAPYWRFEILEDKSFKAESADDDYLIVPPNGGWLDEWPQNRSIGYFIKLVAGLYD